VHVKVGTHQKNKFLWQKRLRRLLELMLSGRSVAGMAMVLDVPPQAASTSLLVHSVRIWSRIPPSFVVAVVSVLRVLIRYFFPWCRGHPGKHALCTRPL